MRMDQLAARQYGVLHRSQLLELGVPGRTVRQWVADERLAKVFTGVYRLPGAPVTWEQRQLAAVLAAGAGAVASHRAAARIWGLLDDDTHEITVPRHLRRLAGVVVHRTSAPARAFRRKGIPTTDPMRTLVDLGAVLPAPAVEDALDRALIGKRLSIETVERRLEEVAACGRNGAGVLRAVLDERALGDDVPDSVLEPRMARLLRRHGLPAAVFQYEVRLDGRFIARIDFAYPELQLAIEVDGFGSHGSAGALQEDLRRQNALVALGWTVLRFTWADVVRRPPFVAAQIAGVLGTLAAA